MTLRAVELVFLICCGERKLVIPLLLTLALSSCSQNRQSRDNVSLEENAMPTVHDSANDLIGTDWFVDVFFISEGMA